MSERAATSAELVIIVVGLTAGWRKRRQARQYYERVFGKRTFLPWIPYGLGLRASAAWLSFRVRRRLAGHAAGQIDLIAYIGGGILVRMLCARGERWPIHRAVWDRSPTREPVARLLTARFPASVLALIGYRSIVDLSRLDVKSLPLPAAAAGHALIVETKPSALAVRLGVDQPPPADTWSSERLAQLLPGAIAAIAVPLSHDEVYSDRRFLDQAAAFIATGAFRGTAGGHPP